MATRISKVQRWLDLLGFLVSRRLPVPVSEIMERVPGYAAHWNRSEESAKATAMRTFERDKDELRRLEIPIETVSYTINFGMETVAGYRLSRRDFYLPYLRVLASAYPPATSREVDRSRVAEVEISYKDARDALDALSHMAELPSLSLSDAARSAFRKLALDLEPAAVRAAPVAVSTARDDTRSAPSLEILSACLQERRRVRFRYAGIHRGTSTDRHVEPYGLLFQGGSWYLVGHDLGRGGRRVFRVGRMMHVEPEPVAGMAYEVPADFDLRSHLHRQAWELGDDADVLDAEVLFHFPRSLWAERNRHGTPRETRADGSAVHRFRVQQTEPFIRWILSLEGEAEVLAPPELKDAVRGAAEGVAALYRRGGAHGDA